MCVRARLCICYIYNFLLISKSKLWLTFGYDETCLELFINFVFWSCQTKIMRFYIESNVYSFLFYHCMRTDSYMALFSVYFIFPLCPYSDIMCAILLELLFRELFLYTGDREHIQSLTQVVYTLKCYG